MSVAERPNFDQPRVGETLNKWFKRNCEERGLDPKLVQQQAQREHRSLQPGLRRSTRAKKPVVKPFSISFAVKQIVNRGVRAALYRESVGSCLP